MSWDFINLHFLHALACYGFDEVVGGGRGFDDRDESALMQK